MTCSSVPVPVLPFFEGTTEMWHADCCSVKKIGALCKTLNMRTAEKFILFGYRGDVQHKSAIVLIV